MEGIATQSSGHGTRRGHAARQKGEGWSCWAYLGVVRNGPRHEMEKLSRFPKDEGAWLMFLATGNPGPEDWFTSVEKFNRKFGRVSHRVRAVTDPADFPDEYFLGLAEVVRG